MLTTLHMLAVMLFLFAFSMALWALFLRFGLRWVKVEGVTMRQTLLTAGFILAVQLVITVALHVFLPESVSALWVGLLAELALGVLVPVMIIKRQFHLTSKRALLAWLPTLVSSTLMLAFLFVVLRPFFFEAYVIPTNAMAPTIVGRHWRFECPECGAPAYTSPPPPGEQFRQSRPDLMICQNFHTSKPPESGEVLFGSDRILVAKHYHPQRWDLVVFRLPDDPSINYVKRLVGLPGETITIKDGAVWADGERLDLPEHLHGIEYLSELPESPRFSAPAPGSPQNPAVLGDDEYFMLGDFSARSKDSRFFGRGAPGHPTYAVPKSHLIGVVTHIYWPFERWRAFRQ